MFLECLSRVLRDEPEIEVVGTANSCVGAVRLAEKTQPDVAILDYRLPDADGVTTATALRAVSSQTQILLLTELDNSHLVTSAIEAGYSGFITKDKAVRELVSAVQVVFTGEAYFSPEVLTALLPRLVSSYKSLGSDLTIRQHEVLSLMATGMGNKEIAIHLDLSLNTIRNHVQKVLVKLGAHSKLEAVAIATREDLMYRTAAERFSGGSDRARNGRLNVDFISVTTRVAR